MTWVGGSVIMCVAAVFLRNCELTAKALRLLTVAPFVIHTNIDTTVLFL